MTSLLIMVLGFFFAYGVYIATRSARAEGRPEAFLDAGLEIPSWGYIFAGTGVILAGLNLNDHFLLVARYGLQASHVAAGLVLVALLGALVQKRLWLAARITRLRSLGELMGEHFGSVAIRIYLLFVLFLFSVPLAAYCLAETGALVSGATGGELPASLVIWVTAFFLFLGSVIGGWRGVVYAIAAQGFLVLALLAFTGAVAVTFDSLASLAQAPADGTLWDRVPGVVQFTDGIGKETPGGGVWTTVAILTFALALAGLVLSPGFAFLGITTSTRKGFAFMQVWMTAGLAAGVLLLVGPLIGAEIAGAPDGNTAFAPILARLAPLGQLVPVAFLLMLVASLQIAVSFYAASGASIATSELVARYMLPELSGSRRKLAARIALAAIYLCVALAATFAPLGAAVFSSLALSLSVQLLPAYLGLCWLPWISRGAVLAGLVLGIVLVVFTEPIGLIAFEALFVELPWGRWPLTIHSAGWGLAFNLAACLLVSIFTRSGAEREQRQRLHDEFAASHRADISRPVRGAMWSLTLIWAFLALGPGAILGNTFFSQPVFAGTAVSLGVPSLLVWQVLFWFMGVFIVWWLAYRARMSIIDMVPRGTIALTRRAGRLERQPTPPWIARLLGRLAER